MAIQIGSNYMLKNKTFLDARQSFDDITAMTSFSIKSLPEGFIAYVKSEDKYYKFNSTNDFDTQLGYWKEYNGGTGSSTDEKVKLNSTSESKYLEELIDNSTIEVDIENGVIKAVSLDGLETTVATLNYVKNLDKDIMSYLNSIGNPMAFKGVVADDDELAAIEGMVSGDTYIVQSSASNGDKTMTFIYNGVEFVPMAETSIEVRDFTAEPIDLATETTGILPKEKIDTGIARVSTTLDKSTYKGSVDGVVKQADKLTGLTATTSQLSEAVTNSHKHTNKTVLDKIVSNGTGSRLWTDAGNYKEIIIKDTVQPLDENVLWLDITDSTNPILKIFDGTDWVITGGNSSTGGSSGEITIDTKMSDTSTNTVQNKVIKKYVDEKSVNISADDNNAIKSNKDGIYVKDLSEDVNRINIAQKTVNKELDWGEFETSSTTIAMTSPIVFSKVTAGNMSIENGFIKLKKGKTYFFGVNLYNIETNGIYLVDSNLKPIAQASSGVTPTFIYHASDDTLISFICAEKTISPDWSFVTVHEIGQSVVIDPLEYVNETQGIEDAPVGHIIAHMGTTAPKHYLTCDGSSVAVADYPYLAQHFKDSFGSEYYFGGSDGMMNLPDLRGEFLRGTGTNSHENQGNGGDVGKHQDATNILGLWSHNENNRLYFRTGATYSNEDSTSNDAGSGLYSTTNVTEASSTNYPKTITPRPTNTSVLYCIKYEPTYFMQNTYNGNVYSTNEQIVGRWIDGKPIYQKTFQFDALPVTTNFTDIEELPNVDTTVDIKHIYSIGNGNTQCTDGIIANASGDGYRLQFAYDNGHLTYYAGEKLTGSEALKNIYVTVQYTKITN